AQEKEIISDPKLLLVAVSALNQISLESMLASYQMAEVEIIRHLLRLDKIGFLQLLPNNRVKLLVSRTFRWLPHGPIQSYFLGLVENDFLTSRFDGEGEWMQLINVMLSRTSILQLQNRLKQLAKEVAAMHQTDAHLPFEERFAISCLLAARPWMPASFRQLLRQPPA
ncbi:MAG: XRE family transcriptional regulator, partial [Burkholderiales bacterium]|nr:XRE family transcriptional regulator [Burkholderiales bacterium]